MDDGDPASDAPHARGPSAQTSAEAALVPVPPPYHVRDVDMLYLLCRFDPVAASCHLGGGQPIANP